MAKLVGRLVSQAHSGSRRGQPLLRWLVLAALGHAILLTIISFQTEADRDIVSAPTPASPVTDLYWLPTDVSSAANATDNPTAARELGQAKATAPRSVAVRSARAKVDAPGAGGSASDGASAAHAVQPLAGEPQGNEVSPERPLSLAELGVGQGNNPFWRMPAGEPSLPQVLNQRVQQMLQSGLAAHDQRVGLGPEGATIRITEDIVRESPTQPNTTGLLAIRTDATGATTWVEVLESSNEPAAWQRIAEELKRQLSNVRLRVPKGSSGVTFQLRVVSRAQLPSGADPGLAVELFGQTLREGAGDRSAKLKLLTPEIVVTEVEIPYTDGRTMPVVGFSPNLISLSGDLADIGAKAQRVVRAHLVALETHVQPVSAP